MVIKTYLKTLLRMFKKHAARLISLFVMVLISVSFVSGIGSAADKIDYSLDAYYKSQNVSDFIIKSKTGRFTEEDIGAIKNILGDVEYELGTSFDIPVDEENKLSLRLYFLDFDNWNINVPDMIEGEKSDVITKVYCEQSDDVIKGFSVGEKVELDFSALLGVPVSKQEVEICAIIQSPLTFNLSGEPSYNNPEDAEINSSVTGTKHLDCLENIIYISQELNPFIPKTDMYVALSDRSVFNHYSDSYLDFVTQKAAEIENAVKNVKVITLKDNYSFASLDFYSEKVLQIGYLLMAAFLLVTALVSLSTMTRLIDEERQQIACLTTLGYSPFGIISKYLLFALIATGLGGFAAYFLGLGLSHFIYYVFNYSFFMPPVSSRVAMVFYIINAVLILIVTLGATAVAGLKTTRENPANMLRPKPPKAGKKVFLERIPVIWNRLSFKYKSTVRNVFRYKSRFFMTVAAVAVSMALVTAGLALLDLCIFGGFDSPAIMGVAVLIVVFAGFLTATVLYTLMNISISERNREIATLMVLGYHNREVSGYMYREVYINVAIGIVFGYPVSVFLAWFLLDVIVTQTLSAVSWFIWLLSPLIVFVFTFIVTMLLYPKIVRVDMNESLKAIE